MTNFTTGDNGGNTGYIAGGCAFVTLGVNTLFFVIGLRTLHKRAHNMLVISMCGSDCLYGLSVFSLAFITKFSGHAFMVFCKIQITLLFIAMASSLTIALTICVERFVTVRHFNFGNLAKSEGWKKKMSVALVTLTTIYVIVCLTAVPSRNYSTPQCFLHVFYDGKQYQIVMALIACLFLFLTLSIIVVYICVMCMLLSYLKYRNQVGPNDSEVSSRQCSENRESEVSDSNQDARSIEVIELNSFSSCIQNSSAQRVHSISALSNIDSDITLSDINVTSISYRRGSFQGRSDSISDTNQNTTVDRQGPSFSTGNCNYYNNSGWTEWEHRALATSGYLIFSTLLLHGPLIACLLCDAFGYQVPIAIGNISTVLVSIQCVVNPFIYAFRFKELREAIIHLFCCKKINSVKQTNCFGEPK